MKNEGNLTDPLERVIRDHENISEYLENFKEILGFLDNEEAWRKVKPIEDFFKRNAVDHFEFEEKEVFTPILLRAATEDSIKLILELQREHGSILRELEEFQKIISENAIPLNQEMNKRFNIVGRRIIDNILLHASKEDDRLLPIMKKM